MDIMTNKEAFKAATAEIKKRGGVPEGTKFVDIYDARHGVTLRFFKTFDELNEAHNGAAVRCGKKFVADLHKKPKKGYHIVYITSRWG